MTLGIGILFAFLVPRSIIIVILSMILIAVGYFLFIGNNRRKF